MLKVSDNGTWLGISSRMGIRLAGVLLAILAAWVMRALGTMFGADYVVTDFFSTFHVTETVCAFYAFQVGIKGLVMIMILERLTTRARTVWTIGGWFLLIVSYWPILVVDALLSTKIFLALINTATALVLLSAVRSNVASPDPKLNPALRALLVVAGIVWTVYTLAGLVPGIDYYGLPITTRLDSTLLRVIALVAILSLFVPRLRQSRRAPRDQVGVAA
jgi:hypothetical protein